MFKVIQVDSVGGATELEKALTSGFRISQTNEFDGGVIYILIDEKKASKIAKL